MESCNLLSESDASCTVDTPIHVGNNQRTKVFVLDCSFELIVSAVLVSVEMGVILKVTLSSLIADGTVKRVISKQKLHDSSSGMTGIL